MTITKITISALIVLEQIWLAISLLNLFLFNHALTDKKHKKILNLYISTFLPPETFNHTI